MVQFHRRVWRIALRVFVLGTAFACAMLVWRAPPVPHAIAAEPPRLVAQAGGGSKQPGPAPESDAKAKRPSPAAEADAKSDTPPADTADANVTIDGRGIHVDKGNKHVHVGGLSGDRDYDSFESFVNDAPWLAGLVFMSVMLIFATPLIVIILLIWYKMRKTRMLNETMVKLAEKGVVPPAGAMEALAAGRSAETIVTGPATTPLYDQARRLQRQAAWSDLRKGVVLTAVGLAFQAYWTIHAGEASWVGLVLLFLGIGYCILWFFEDRGPRTPGEPGPPAAGG